MTAPIEQLAGQGILGLMLFIALYAIKILHEELKAERLARVQDGKDSTALLLTVQKAITDTVGKFHELVKSRDAK